MNLHAIAGPIVAAVNPPVPGELLRSTGYATGATGRRDPSYADPEPLQMQVQALTGPELRLIEGLNIAGVKRAIHLPGDVKAADRAAGSGGDIVHFPAGPGVPETLADTTWLVVMVMETWDTGEWCRVAVVKQNGA